MNTEIQSLIIKLLGTIAAMALIEVLLLLLLRPDTDITLLIVIGGIVTNITSGLVGFLTGKAIIKEEQSDNEPVMEETNLDGG